MSSVRRLPLVAALATALIATGVASTLIKQTNPTSLPTGLDVASNAESTALYCTGLSSAAGGLAGHVTFLNTTSAVRTLAVQVVSDAGKRASTSIRLAGHAARSIQPDKLAQGNSFGVAAQVDGGGVVAEEVTSDRGAEVPCTSSGVTSWYGSGFDSLVGSNAALSIYNPTATPAVLDVTTFSSTGFVAPAPFQGLSVGAHAQVELNLGAQIVNSSNIGVRVNVLRGSTVIVGVQRSGKVVSMDPGSTSVVTTAFFPRVTTVSGAEAQIRLANPGARPADVTVDVKLSPYSVAPQTVTVAPFSSGVVVLTPNPAIPAAGYATVQMTSSQPVIASLAAGTKSGLALSPAVAPAAKFLLADFAGKGFDAATVTNTSSRTITVTFTTVPNEGQVSVSSSVRLAGNTTSDILGLFSGITTFSATTVLVTASRPLLLVTTTLPTTPKGVTVISPLDGG